MVASMEAVLLAMAILAQPQTRCGHRQARELAEHSIRLEREYRLPPGLISAVALAESGGRARLVIHHRGRCEVGLGQIRVDCDQRRVTELKRIDRNLEEAARLLDASRRKCAKHPEWASCRLPFGSEFGLYNANSKTWSLRVKRIRNRILKEIERLKDGGPPIALASSNPEQEGQREVDRQYH
jgi:hypothetical protein